MATLSNARLPGRSALLAVVANAQPGNSVCIHRVAAASKSGGGRALGHCQVHRCRCDAFANATADGVCTGCGHGAMYHHCPSSAPTVPAHQAKPVHSTSTVAKPRDSIVTLLSQIAELEESALRKINRANESTAGPDNRRALLDGAMQLLVSAMDSLDGHMSREAASIGPEGIERTTMERLLLTFETAQRGRVSAQPAAAVAPTLATSGAESARFVACSSCDETTSAAASFCHNCGLRRCRCR